MKGASLVAQRLKHLPAMRETWVQSLGREDPLEKEMETHSSTLAWSLGTGPPPGPDTCHLRSPASGPNPIRFLEGDRKSHSLCLLKEGVLMSE